MPAFSAEPSSLIALRELGRLEQERQDQDRAEQSAREAAAAAARAAAEEAAREAAEARMRAEQEAAERTRRDEERRCHEERLRAAEIEGRLRGAQAIHLARVEAELADAARSATRRSRTRVGLLTAAALGLTGLGVALLLHGAARPPAPVLAVDEAPDPALVQARADIAEMRRKLAELKTDDAEREALERAIAAAQAPPPAPTPAPTPTAVPRPRPRPAAAPAPTEPKPPKRHGGIICKNLDDPLAEDCPEEKK